MFKAASVFLVAAVMAQSASSQERQATPPASDRTAPNARGDADANANAPAAPALDQEPHGSGTVFQELDALRNENRSKDSGR